MSDKTFIYEALVNAGWSSPDETAHHTAEIEKRDRAILELLNGIAYAETLTIKSGIEAVDDKVTLNEIRRNSAEVREEAQAILGDK